VCVKPCVRSALSRRDRCKPTPRPLPDVPSPRTRRREERQGIRYLFARHYPRHCSSSRIWPGSFRSREPVSSPSPPPPSCPPPPPFHPLARSPEPRYPICDLWIIVRLIPPARNENLSIAEDEDSIRSDDVSPTPVRLAVNFADLTRRMRSSSSSRDLTVLFEREIRTEAVITDRRNAYRRVKDSYLEFMERKISTR